MLQMTQHHDAAKVTNVERVSRRVGTQIGCYHFLLKQFFCSRHNLREHAAPL